MPPSKMAEWFEGRRWRVVTEFHGKATAPLGAGDERVAVHFRHGHFTIDPPGAFRSPLSGNPGRRGVMLQEVDAEGNDIPGSRHPFGEPVLKSAREDFHAIK